MTYDSRADVVVVLGGRGDTGVSKRDVLEWDGVVWTPRTPSPTRGSFVGLSYDEWRHRLVLFDHNSTWEWDGNTWEPRYGGGPSDRYGHAMVFDGARGVTVLFGGYDMTYHGPGHRYLGDTWEWDGEHWTLREAQGPSARYLHAMAYDASRGVTVLMGGADGAIRGDLWEWDGAQWRERWAEGPMPRRVHALAYDLARQVTVLYGGAGPEDEILNDTWEWNGSEWRQLPVSGPAAREHHAMAYHPGRSMVVLAGGTSAEGKLDDTWELVDCARDLDGDGVDDRFDACHGSDTAATIRIGLCDTGVPNRIGDDGCTMADDVVECANDAATHGPFVSCVAEVTRGWLANGLIERNERGSVQRCAAGANELGRRAQGRTPRPRP